MTRHSGILGSILAHGVDADETIGLRSGRQLTRDDIVRLSEQATSQWRDTFANLLSAFQLDGEFGLWATLGTYYQTNPLPSSVNDAAVVGDEYAFTTAMYKALCAAFIDLYGRRNALSRIQLVDELPAEALFDYARMQTAIPAAQQPASPVTQAAPVTQVVVENPTEVCAREWKELSGDRFKAKYMNNRNYRPIYEQALDEGKI